MVLGGVVRGARPPSHTAYYVALAGVLSLLLLLCCYFIYFCIKRVKELSRGGLPEPVQSVRPPPPAAPVAPSAPSATPYPVQPLVRASASAMAHLCRPRSPAAHSALPAHSVAQRSSSLVPAHTHTVHPHTQPHTQPHTLPPPTVLTPRTTPIKHTPRTIPGRIDLVPPVRAQRTAGNGPLSPRSPQRRDVSPIRKAVPPSRIAVSPNKMAVSPNKMAVSPNKMALSPIGVASSPLLRRERRPNTECTARKHLSGPPAIVVGDLQ